MDTLHEDLHTFLHVPQAPLTTHLLLAKMIWTNIRQKDKACILHCLNFFQNSSVSELLKQKVISMVSYNVGTGLLFPPVLCLPIFSYL